MSDFVSVILLYLAIFTLLLAVLAATTHLGVSRLEAAHPPTGRFVEVQGVRLHVDVLGLPRDAPGANPPVVLIHGASGNLEDMRLALGEKLAASHRVILIDRPGHGWSSRPDSDDCASPARQAELVAGALEQIGVRRAILIGHSWGGAFATAYALAFPERTAGLVLLAAVTHPWPGDPGWYNKLALLPCVGPLFLSTCVYPLGLLMVNDVLRSVFEPQAVPNDYMRRAAIRLVLRPKTFHSNALDLAQLKKFITAQVPHYAELVAPTVIITGDADTTVSPQINARALAAALPRAKLVLLKDIGHMPHHAAPDVVAAAIDELASREASARACSCRRTGVHPASRAGQAFAGTCANACKRPSVRSLADGLPARPSRDAAGAYHQHEERRRTRGSARGASAKAAPSRRRPRHQCGE